MPDAVYSEMSGRYLETSGKRRVWGLAFLGVYFGFV